MVHATATLLAPLLALAALWVAIFVVARRIVTTDRSRTYSLYNKKRRRWRWTGKMKTNELSAASTPMTNITTDGSTPTMLFKRTPHNFKENNQEKPQTVTNEAVDLCQKDTENSKSTVDKCTNSGGEQCAEERPANGTNDNSEEPGATVRSNHISPLLCDRSEPCDPPSANGSSKAAHNGTIATNGNGAAPQLMTECKRSRSPSPAAGSDRIPPNRSKSALLPATSVHKVGSSAALVLRAQSQSAAQARAQNGNFCTGLRERKKRKKEHKALVTVAVVMGCVRKTLHKIFFHTGNNKRAAHKLGSSPYVLS